MRPDSVVIVAPGGQRSAGIGQNAELSASSEGVGQKVYRSTLVWPQQNRHWGGRPLAATTAAHRPALFPINPVRLLFVHHHAVALQHDPDAPIPEPAPHLSNLVHFQTDLRVAPAGVPAARFSDAHPLPGSTCVHVRERIRTQARRRKIKCPFIARSTASRRCAGVVRTLQEDPSTPRCRAWCQPPGTSAFRSPPQAASGA